MSVRARRRIAAILAIMVLAAGCGLPSDSEPTAIAPEDIPGELVNLPDETIPPDEGTEADIYLYNTGSEKLGIQMVVVVERNPSSVITELLDWQAADPTDPDAELTTNIPPGTELMDIERRDSTAIIDLSEEFGDTERAGQIQAVAQIVYTLTSFDEFDEVEFEIDGTPSPVPDGEGATQDVVDRASYPDLEPTEG